MTNKAIAVVIGFFLAWSISRWLAVYTVKANRRVEMKANEEAGEVFSESDMQWSIIHIRDDLGALHNMTIITNALLAGILAALLF